MLNLVLALAAAAPTVIDAERAFAQMAQDKGQWTAFRAYAAPGAVMFTPQPVKAQKFLKDKKDPPKAIRWQPTHAWVSCDGTLAVDTGNWQSADGKAVGFFTTVWKRQADGSWKWVYDHGDALTAARPDVAEPKLVKAACSSENSITSDTVGHGKLSPNKYRSGQSADGSIDWTWMIDVNGYETFYALVWGLDLPAVVDRFPVAEK